MPFDPNIPQSIDFLSESQLDLLNNNIQLDASFGVDHYKFSNVTVNNGRHNYVTTPLAVNTPATVTGHPDVTATELRFYAMQDTANIGLLQYSRGWDAVGATSAVPSAVTYLQSPNAAQTLLGLATSTLNIFDFTGITKYAMAKVYIYNNDLITTVMPAFEGLLTWRGASNELTVNEIYNSFASNVKFEQSGNFFRMRRSINGVTLNDIYWTIQFLRIVI